MTRFQDAAYKLAEEAATIKQKFRLTDMEMRDVLDIVKTEYADLVRSRELSNAAAVAVARALAKDVRLREDEDGSMAHRFEDGKGRSVLK